VKGGRIAAFLSQKRGRYIAAALLLLLIALLAILFRDVAREIIVLPILYLFWLFGVLWRSIPQSLIWGIFVIVALRVAVGALLARRRRAELHAGQQDTVHWGRARVWSRWVRLSARGGYEQRRLARYLSELALAAIAQHEHLPLEDTRAALEGGTLDVPSEIRDYILAALAGPAPARFGGLRERLQSRPAALRLDAAEVVRFLETLVGVGR
jgi:hypothetical protein